MSDEERELLEAAKLGKPFQAFWRVWQCCYERGWIGETFSHQYNEHVPILLAAGWAALDAANEQSV
jgi:hypothetical protein